MLFHRYGKFTGGIDLPEEKQATIDEPISAGPLPDELHVPLNYSDQMPPASPAVSPGQAISRGELLARATQGGLDIFAPANGVVRDISTRDITLTKLRGQSELLAREPVRDWEKLSAEQLRELIREGQLPTFRRPGEAIIDWLEEARRHRSGQLVINAMEDQPFVTADHRLLVEHGPEVIAGASILSKAGRIGQVTLAADQLKTENYQHLTAPAQAHGLERVALPRRYPIGADNILLSVLTGREVPCGGKAADIALAIIDAASCFAIYRWVACGDRLAGRVVTLSGPGVKRPGNLFVLFGTPCRELAGPAEGPLVVGGPMIGSVASARSVVGPGCDAVLALEPTSPGVATQCVRCGWCRDHCPTRLNVAVLNDLYELGHVQPADLLGVLSCLGCGVCSYVCPAVLPLTERMRQLKKSLHALPGRDRTAEEKFARHMRRRGTRRRWLARRKKQKQRTTNEH